ncbi:hypothetical protein L917_07023, partial [Phytophthora nicotianae]
VSNKPGLKKERDSPKTSSNLTFECFFYDATNLAFDQHRHFTEGPLNVAAVIKAKNKLLRPCNHRVAKVKTGRTIIFINCESTIVVQLETSNKQQLKFKQSLTGNLGEEESIKTAEVQFLSMQQVIVEDSRIEDTSSLALRAKWSCDEIQAVRNALGFTCKSYLYTGWACAHVIVSLDLLGKIKIGLTMAAIPMRGLPGRPRALAGPLQRESDIDVTNNEKTYKEHWVGQVAGCRVSETDGVYIWSFAFVHGDSLEYQVENLAHAICRAYSLGTQ